MRVNTERPEAFISALAGLRRFRASRRRYGGLRTTHPLEVLVDSFLEEAQHKVRKEATAFRPNVIVAETSFAGYLSLTARECLDTPLITDIHGLLGEETRLKRSRYASILSEVEKIAFHQSDYLLAVSNPMKTQMCLKLEINPDKVLVVPNGGDTVRLHANFSLPLKAIYAGWIVSLRHCSTFLVLTHHLGSAVNSGF